MAIQTIVGSWSGTVAMNWAVPTLVALDAEAAWFTGSFDEWEWHGPETTPMPWGPTPATGWLQNDVIFDPLTVRIRLNSYTADGTMSVGGYWVYAEPDGTVVATDYFPVGGDAFTLPSTGSDIPGQSLGEYHHLVLHLLTYSFDAATTATVDVDWIITRETADAPSGEGGIYVGTIVLADPIAGLYRYTNIEEPFLFEWNAPFSGDELWLGSRDNLAGSTGGLTRRRVIAATDGWYPWTVTPLFAVDNATTKVRVVVFDGVGDFYAIDEVRYVSSGDTITGAVYLQAGFSATFEVSDDADPPGQATLVGSFWNFPA